MLSSRTFVVSAAALVLGAGLAIAQPERGAAPSKAPEAAQPAAPAASLPVPDAVKKLGTVYYTVSNSERQITFNSDAPVEKIEGHSNAVIGYAVAGPKDNPAKLAAGEWHMPVTSLKTGNTTRDGHLAGGQWLEATKFADIVFKLKEVKDITEAKGAKAGTKSFDCTLVGDMTIHGVTKPMTITGAKVSMLAGDENTAKIVAGDLMKIDATYSVKLGDFEVKNKIVGQKVADDIQIKTSLILSTVDASAKGGKAPAGKVVGS